VEAWIGRVQKERRRQSAQQQRGGSNGNSSSSGGGRGSSSRRRSGRSGGVPAATDAEATSASPLPLQPLWARVQRFEAAVQALLATGREPSTEELPPEGAPFEGPPTGVFGGVGVGDIPWPRPNESALGLEAGDCAAAVRRKLRRSLLFWHPDRFHRTVRALLLRQARDNGCSSGSSVSAEQEEVVLERAHAVTRRILAEKDALGL
jgi:hypothetical protein